MMSTATSGAEEEYVRSKTAVWWDIENCEVPKGCDAHAIAQNVSSALLKLNYYGPVSITAYGDTNLIPHAIQQALSSTGVGLSHVPAGVKDASDKKILVDMLLWAIDNPAPANIMLISGDRDFSNALHQLRMRRYNILLAQPRQASVPLVTAARNVWLWTSLAVGDRPLGESSRVESNENCQVPTSKTLNDSVAEQAKSSKEIDSISNIVDTTDHNKKKPQNGRATNESYAFVASRKAQASVSAKPIPEADLEEPVWCTVCQISCKNKDIYVSHTYGKRHQKNLEIQSGKESLEKQKKKNKKKDYVCLLCNVVCQRHDFYIHLKGKKHAANVSQPESLNQAHIESEKHQEKGEDEKDQPRETLQLHSQNAQENTKCSEKQTEEVKEICGTSEGSVKEIHPRNKESLETVNKPLLNGEYHSSDLRCAFKIPRKTGQWSGGIWKPVNQSEGVTEHLGEVKKKIEKTAFVARDDAQKSVTTEPVQEVVEHVWCQVCQISCTSKVDYANHSYGKKHRQNLELQSAKQEVLSSRPAKISKDNAEKKNKNKVVCQDQTVIGSHLSTKKYVVVVKEQKEDLTDPRKTREESNQEKENPGEASQEQSLGKSSGLRFQGEESNQEKEHPREATKEHVLEKINGVGIHGGGTDQEKEKINGHRFQGEESNQEKDPEEAIKEQSLEKINGLGFQEGSDQEKENPREVTEEEALGKINGVRLQGERSDEEKEHPQEATKEQALEKMNGLGIQVAQDNNEESKERNDISDSSKHHDFTQPKLESLIHINRRGCLDVIPEIVELSPDVNVTEKLKTESKDKPEEHPRVPDKESTGRKERSGAEATEREEVKSQVDNFWTRLWGKKS